MTLFILLLGLKMSRLLIQNFLVDEGHIPKNLFSNKWH